MGISRSKRIFILLSLSAAILALLILAAGMDGFAFAPTMQRAAEMVDRPVWRGLALDLTQLDRFILVLTVLLISVYAYVLWRYPSLRPRGLILGAVILVIFVAAVVLWPPAVQMVSQEIPEDAVGPARTPLPTEDRSPTKSEEIETSSAMIYAVGFGITAVVLGLAGGAWLLLNRGRQQRAESLPDLAVPVREALEDVQGGGDLRNAIIRCYYEMTRIAGEHEHLKKEAGSTPREFARHLEAAGLPENDVRRLTALFEAVRYGKKSFSRHEEEEAAYCLASILKTLEGIA